MRAFLITFSLVFASVVGRADTIENPEFKQWAAFKSGTSIVMSMTSEFNGTKSASKIGTKLLEVGADKIVLEVETATVVNGMEFKGPPTKREVTKTIEIPKVEGAQATPKPGVKPEGTTEEGTETVKIGDVEVKTKWTKYKSKTPAGEVEGQTWMSDEIPGGMFKSETKTATITSKMVIVEFKKP